MKSFISLNLSVDLDNKRIPKSPEEKTILRVGDEQGVRFVVFLSLMLFIILYENFKNQLEH